MTNATFPEFQSQSEVEAELKKRGAQFTKVSFTKKDGTVTTRTGMPKVYTRRVGGEKGPAATPEAIRRSEIAKKSLKDNGNIWMDYPKVVDKKTGFSFNLGRVIAVGSLGQHPE